MTIDNPDTREEVYLGDAVYASFDGYHIWLRTGDGNNQRIALEPNVLTALDSYRTRLDRVGSSVGCHPSIPVRFRQDDEK